LLDAIGPDVMCASFCKRIVAYDGEAAFLYETLKRAREIGDVERFEVQSTGIKNLGFQKFIAGLTVSRPPAALRRNFQSTVQPIYELISTIGRQNSNLRAQRDLLLPRLVSGKLDVSELGDLEKEAADA
jgi:type I restriction enzyme, S subunit